MKMIRIKKDKRITILALSWRDIKSPKAGGAEVFTHNLFKFLPSNKYRIIHIAPLYHQFNSKEIIDGIHYYRYGNLFTVITYAIRFYWKNRKSIDYVIDQCNTHQFFSPLWLKRSKRIFFIHQLTREFWTQNLRFPFGHIGHLLKSKMLRLHRKDISFTVSPSTKNDLLEVGFNSDKLFILPEGLDFTPWSESNFLKKSNPPAFLYLGRYSNYKEIDQALQAFGRFRQIHKNGTFHIVGNKNSKYILNVLEPIYSEFNLVAGKDVIEHGFVTHDKKLKLMSSATALLFPSQREDCGLTIIEAAAVGSPTIAYCSPGLIDAVDNGKAGFLCKENTVIELERLLHLTVNDQEQYKKIRSAAYKFSKTFNWQRTADTFDNFMIEIIKKRDDISFPSEDIELKRLIGE